MITTKHTLLKAVLFALFIYGVFFSFVVFTLPAKQEPQRPNLYFLGSILSQRDVDAFDYYHQAHPYAPKRQEIMERHSYNLLIPGFKAESEKPSLANSVTSRKLRDRYHPKFTAFPKKIQLETQQGEAMPEIEEYVPLKLPSR